MVDASVAPEVTGPLAPGALGPLDPALQQSIAIANAPSAAGGITSAQIQALSVTPPEYYVLTQLTEKQREFLKAQTAADIRTDIRALTAQREVIERQIKEKEKSMIDTPEYQKGVAEAKAERARLDAKLAAETKGVTGGSFNVTTLGIETYNKDVAAQKAVMTEMQKAIEASDSPAARAAAMKNYQESVNKLDELYALKPFSSEWKTKYPDVTKTQFFGSIIIKQGPGREAALAQQAAERGEAPAPRVGLSAITDASGNYVYDASGQYVGTGSLAYAQSAQGALVKQAVEADAKVLADAYARIAADPKATPSAIESAYQASKSAAEIASRTTKLGVILTVDQASGLTDKQKTDLGVDPKLPTLQDVVSRVDINPFDPNITIADRKLHGLVKEISPSMNLDDRARVQSELGKLIGEKAARDYIASATQPKTGVGSQAWYADQLTSREAQAKANIIGGVTPEGKVITTKPEELKKPFTSFLPSTSVGQTSTAVENVTKTVTGPGGVDVLGWMGGVKDLAVRMVTTTTKPEYLPVTSIALLPGGVTTVAGPAATVTKGGTALDALKTFFAKPLVSAPPTAVTAAAIIPSAIPTGKPTIEPSIPSIGKKGGVEYTTKEAPITPLAGRLQEAVKITVPEVKIAETGKLDKPFEFTSLTPKNEKDVSGFLNTMNYYTKGKPLTDVEQSALSGMLKTVNLSDRDKTQITDYLANYQVYAKETQTLQSGLSKIASGEADASTVTSVANSISKISEYSPSSAKEFNQSFKDYAAIGQINQVLKSPEAKRDWGTTVSVAQAYASTISDPTLKAKYTYYPVEVAVYDQSVAEINNAVASTKPLSAAEQQAAINKFNITVDGLTIIPSDKRQELKSTYASALQVPGLYKEVDLIVASAPAKGISDTELSKIKYLATTNPLLNEAYEVKDPKTGKAIIDEKTGKPVTSTYAKDIVNEVTKVKEGYITPEEFKKAHPFLGSLLVTESKEIIAEREAALGFKPPTVESIGSGVVYAAGYDFPNIIAEKFDWTKSVITQKPSEYKAPPKLTTEATTLGYGLDYIQPLIKERVFEKPLGGTDITIAKTWGGAVEAVVGTQEKVGSALLESVIKPTLGTTPEAAGRATAIGEAGKFGTEFERGLLMSPIEKPVETLASIGVGKLFAAGMPVLETGLARFTVPTLAKAGVAAPAAEKVTKYGLAAALTAPYAFETIGRIATSERPGYTAGQIVGTELIPMSIGAGLTSARIKEAGRVGVEGGRTAVRGIRELDFGRLFGERPITVSRGPALPIEAMPGSPKALEAQMKILREAGTAVKAPTQVERLSLLEQERLSNYLSNYREGVIQGATKGAGSTDPGFLKLVDEAVVREQTRLARLPPLERASAIGIPKTAVEIPQIIPAPESAKGLEIRMKALEERGEAVKAPTKAERESLMEQERLSNYLSTYRDTLIKETSGGAVAKEPNYMDLILEAVTKEQARIQKMSPAQRRDLLSASTKPAITAPIEPMIGSRRWIESQLKVLGERGEAVKAPTQAERLSLMEQERLADYLSTYRETLIKDTSGGAVAKEPNYMDLINEAVKTEQTRVQKLPLDQRTNLLSVIKPSVTAKIEPMVGSKRWVEAQMKALGERGEAVKAPTKAERESLMEQERLSNYLSTYRDTLIKETSGGAVAKEPNYMDLINEAVKTEQTRVQKLPLDQRTSLLSAAKPSVTAKIEPMVGSQRWLESRLKALEKRGEAVKAPTKAERASLLEQERLANYLSTYRDTLLKETGGGAVAKEPNYMDLINEAVKTEQTRVQKLPLDQRTSLLSATKPSVTAKIEPMTGSLRDIQLRMKELQERGLAVPERKLTASELEIFKSREKLAADLATSPDANYLLRYRDGLIKEARDSGMNVNDPSLIKSIDDMVRLEQTSRLGKLVNERELAMKAKDLSENLKDISKEDLKKMGLTPSDVKALERGQLGTRSQLSTKWIERAKAEAKSGGAGVKSGKQELLLKQEQKVKVEEKVKEKPAESLSKIETAVSELAKPSEKAELFPTVTPLDKLQDLLKPPRPPSMFGGPGAAPTPFKFVDIKSPYEKIVPEVKEKVKVEQKVEEKAKLKSEAKVKEEVKSDIGSRLRFTIESQVGTITAQKPVSAQKEALKEAQKEAQMEAQKQVIREAQKQATREIQREAQKQREAQVQAQKQATKEIQIEQPKLRPAQVIKTTPKEMEREIKIPPPRLEVKEKALPPKLPGEKREPWGWDPLTRERLAMRRIQAPIATGMQLLTGKGLFNIKYNIGIPSKISARAGLTARKTSPSQISSQFTGEKMGLRETKPSRPTIGEGSKFGENIGNVFKTMAKPAVRKAIKKKSKLKRKKR